MTSDELEATVGLTVEGMTVEYGKAKAVENVSFACRYGEISAIVGPNGAGKSSLLNAIAGGTPSRGTVRIDSKSVTDLSPVRRARNGMCIVPQGRHVFASLTVEENFEVIADTLHLPSESIAAALNRFPILNDRRKMPAGLLSGGEQQMLEISRALMANPRVLLLDEPALGLAPSIVEELMTTVRKTAASGGIVLITEPSTATLHTRIDCGFVMQRGNLVAVGSGARLADASRSLLGI